MVVVTTEDVLLLITAKTIQDYVHPDDQTQPTFEMTPGSKPFTIITL